MKQSSKRRLLMAGAIMFAVAAATAGTAYAQPGGDAHATPKSWNYDIKDGKRVPKANRVSNADGSWREESKQGSCTTIKESSAQGEVKTTRTCN